VVNLRTKFYDNQSFYEQTQRFCKALTANASFTNNLVLEENKGIMFVKIDTTPKFGSMRVEVTFKLMAYFATPKSEELILEYTKVYPESRSLYLIIRTLARRSKIDNPSNGGFNTLSLFLLVVAFCQKFRATGLNEATDMVDNQIPKQSTTSQSSKLESLRAKIAKKKSAVDDRKAQASLGDMLLKLLAFYAYSFDYTRFLVHPFLPSEKYRDPFQKKPDMNFPSLVILHPYQPQINITKALRKALKLKQALKLAYVHLFSDYCDTDDPSNQDKYTANEPTVNHNYLSMLSLNLLPSITITRADSAVKTHQSENKPFGIDSLKAISAKKTNVSLRISEPTSFDIGSAKLTRTLCADDFHAPLLLLRRVLDYNYDFHNSKSK